MTNKTITLPRELVDTAVNGYVQEQGHALNKIRELLASKHVVCSAALAEPVPPTYDDDRHLSVLALHDVMHAVPSSSLYSLAEAVLDAGYMKASDEITRLQTEVERLKARDLGVKLEVFESVCNERDALQSELTKARDALLKILHASEWTRDDAHYREVAQTLAGNATNQSAPAEKYTWRLCSDGDLPGEGVECLIVANGVVRIGARFWDEPGPEDTYQSYMYWDDPDTQHGGWEPDDVTHWMPANWPALPE